jgi:O-methyltransferase
MVTDEDMDLIDRFSEFTMTGTTRQYALMQAVRYIDQRRIPGDIVECGVWRGGAMMLAKAVQDPAAVKRDTFAGMAKPTDLDVGITSGRPAMETFSERQGSDYVDWCYSSLDEVQGNFKRAGLFGDDLIWHKGLVEDTLKTSNLLPSQIALLRLDTDFYESTAAEMEILYPRLTPGGVLIVDDYGTWAGAKKAVDEYLDKEPLLKCAVDSDCIVATKV